MQLARTQFREGHPVRVDGLVRMVADLHALQKQGQFRGHGEFHQPFQIKVFRPIHSRKHFQLPMFGVGALFAAERLEFHQGRLP